MANFGELRKGEVRRIPKRRSSQNSIYAKFRGKLYGMTRDRVVDMLLFAIGVVLASLLAYGALVTS
jgi:hypothetical protein